MGVGRWRLGRGQLDGLLTSVTVEAGSQLRHLPASTPAWPELPLRVVGRFRDQFPQERLGCITFDDLVSEIPQDAFYLLETGDQSSLSAVSGIGPTSCREGSRV